MSRGAPTQAMSTGTPRNSGPQLPRATAGTSSAGKTCRASAPCCTAARASLGVQTPGRLRRPRLRAQRTRSPSRWGLATSAPPARATARTSSLVTTVPAPTSTLLGSASTSRPMISSAPGKLRGTSMIRTPASASVLPACTASAGCTPCSTVTTGQATRACSNRCLVSGVAGVRVAACAAAIRAAAHSACRAAAMRKKLAACMAARRNQTVPPVRG
mmetsp:Transcript_7292/g.20187  ORF Transcript_7292/g.20187 Transcript_7292/m.20187 type:complete len:216 (-) Transcript_7292:883-1530(-)